MSFLDRIKALNNYKQSNKKAFIVDGKRVGQVREDKLELVLKSDIFDFNSDYITLKAKSFEDRNRDLEEFVDYLAKEGAIKGVKGELYAIREEYNDEPLALVDRAASTTLGLNSYGVHVNGYIKDGNSIKMWIATRAKGKGFEDGKLDHIAAGGLPYNISAKENVIKECYEEASIPKEIAKKAVLTGFVQYRYEYENGGQKDTIFCYDLELPKDFVPKVNDGEVEKFELMDIKEVANIVENSNRFKTNCNLVIIDFLVRHGIITEKDRDYFKIVKGLR